MAPYIYTERNNIHILDLVQTAQLLKRANSYVAKAASEEKTFLFIGTKRQASTLIAQEAKRCNSYYVNHHWLGGMLTNWITLESRIKRLRELEEQEANQIFELLPKKEASIRKKELEKLRKHLNGVKDMVRGTFRKPGYCKAWQVFVELGLCDDTQELHLPNSYTMSDWLGLYLPAGAGNLKSKLQAYTNCSDDSIEKIDYLGKDLLDMTPEARASEGIFLGFQYPFLPPVCFQLLQLVLKHFLEHLEQAN